LLNLLQFIHHSKPLKLSGFSYFCKPSKQKKIMKNTLNLVFNTLADSTDSMSTTDIWTIIIAAAALIVSIWSYLDSNFIFKLDTTIGKHVKLYVGGLDGIIDPVIFMNVGLINNGGKTKSIQDVKLQVEISGLGIPNVNKDFISEREFTDIFNDSAPMTEVLPIVVNSKSTTIQKYVFFPESNILQAQIPSTFNISCTVYVKLKDNWEKQKSYKAENISNVWQDLSGNIVNQQGQSIYKSSLIHMEEIN
jgi:hypothetical protein